jgi:hypothetical protein
MLIDDTLKSMGFDEDFIKYSLSNTKLKDKIVTNAIFLFHNSYTKTFTIKLELDHPIRKSASHTYLKSKFEKEIRDYKLNKILNEK